MGIANNLADPAARKATDRDTVERLLAAAERPAGLPPVQLEAQLLLAYVMQQPRSSLLAWPEREVPPQAATRYRSLLSRVASGEPLAYLVGEREFWSLPLTVNPAVLVPRPETELVVERCLCVAEAAGASDHPSADHPSTHHPAADSPLVDRRSAANPVRRVCDLGTGSGAIVLALARERPAWQLTATDCSGEALQVARLNAERLGARIELLHGDWCAPLGGRRFDVIASNPPYIAAADPALPALRYEPRQALTPGPSGLEALEAIIRSAADHLLEGGWLVLEHGAAQAAQVRRLLVAADYACICSHRDLAGHLRVTEARRPQSRAA